MQFFNRLQKVWETLNNQRCGGPQIQLEYVCPHQLRCAYAVFSTSSAIIVQKPKMIATRRTAINRCTAQDMAGHHGIGTRPVNVSAGLRSVTGRAWLWVVTYPGFGGSLGFEPEDDRFSARLSAVARGEAKVERGRADVIVGIWAVIRLSLRRLEPICQYTMRFEGPLCRRRRDTETEQEAEST